MLAVVFNSAVRKYKIVPHSYTLVHLNIHMYMYNVSLPQYESTFTCIRELVNHKRPLIYHPWSYSSRGWASRCQIFSVCMFALLRCDVLGLGSYT